MTLFNNFQLAGAIGVLILALFSFASAKDSPVIDGLTVNPYTLSGAEAVTTDGVGQAETNSVITVNSKGETVDVVTYNDRDTPPFIEYATGTSHGDTRTVRTFASLMGWSVSVNGGPWVHGKVVPSSRDFPVFWGDPSIARMPGTNSVFLMNLAAVGSKWPASGAVTDSEDGSTPGMHSVIGGACIAKSDDNGLHFSLFQCITHNQHFWDGSSLAGATGVNDGYQGQMYAAFVDTDTGKIDVWLAIGSGQFEQLPDPFPGKSFSAHPRLRGSSGLLGLGWLTALDDSGNLWLNSFSPHLGGWGSPRLVASGVSNGAHGVKLRDGTKIRENGGFAFDVGGFDLGEIVNPPIPFEARFWYPTYVDGFMVLKGARCDLHSTAPCQSPPNWTTPAGFNSFLPAVAVATQRFPSTQPIFHWKMSYVTEERSPVGQVTVASIDFNLNIPSGDGTRSFPFGTQTPCPDGRGYWGDYDDMQVIGNDGILPAFVRPFTDSTDGVCTKQFFKASPQHISQVTLPLIHAGVKPTGGGICKADESGLSLIAVFGYNNPNSFDVSLPVGAKNKFTGRGIAENQGQPTTFSPGHHSGIRVSFRAGEGPPAWTLDGTTVEAEIGPRGLQSCHPLLEF